MRVRIIAQTQFHGEVASALTDGVWYPDMAGTDAANLSEFAGRACYQSWSRPNEATSTNEGYIDHIIEVGHNTVLEHGTVSIYIDEVSRSFTHEMIRHRHNSYSQLSQRFVVQGKPEKGKSPFITPALFRDSELAGTILLAAWEEAMHSYDALLGLAETILSTMTPTDQGGTAHRRKEAREAARCVLPNMTPTAIIVSGNHSAWRDFLTKRASLHADAEIREVAMQIFYELEMSETNLYQDFRVMMDDRGRSYLVRDAED
jgi:thymidylate synthase (FAD)